MQTPSRTWIGGLTVLLAAGLVVTAVLAGAPADKAAPAAGDWPAWRGPNRDGISTETGWRTDWAANPPKVLWKFLPGEGFSATSVAGSRAYAMGFKEGAENVYCLNADTGAVIWKKSYPGGGGDDVPRATPTVDDGRVYTLSSRGDLYCLQAEDGKVVWNFNVSTVGGKRPQYGYACSPLVAGDRLIIDVGPLVAVNKADGKVLWKAGEEPAGYASPVTFKIGPDTFFASFAASGPFIVTDKGEVTAKAQWNTAYNVNAATPIIDGSTLFISSGYDRGAGLFDVTATALTKVWDKKCMRNHVANSILYKGCLYGFDGQVDDGPLTCVDYKTGDVKWQQKGTKAGALMIADGKLVVQDGKGDLILAEAVPDGFKELGRMTKLLEERCWTPPTLAGGRIYTRNARGDLICVDVRGK